jgi:hypothetical protein
MSTHKVNEITWSTLIKDSETAIQTCRDKIKELRKSIVFFKKQQDAGNPFPVNNEHITNTHQDLS